MHFLATVMVCLGAHFSAIWIIVANSWMQTPTAYRIVETARGHARRDHRTSGARSSTRRRSTGWPHTIMGCLAGRRLLRRLGRRLLPAEATATTDFARAVDRASPWAWRWSPRPGQLVTGHDSAMTIAEHQPAKLAAFEGIYETGPRADLTVFGWVDEDSRSRSAASACPGMLSWLVGGSTRHGRQGPERHPAGRPPAGAAQLPALPPDGRHRHDADRAGLGRRPAGLARRPLPASLAAVGPGLLGAAAAARQPAGLGRGRGRPAAVDRLRPDAHRRRRQRHHRWRPAAC